MPLLPLSVFIIFIYSLSSGWQWLQLSGKLPQSKTTVLSLGGIAVVGHGYLLYRWIDLGIGQNLAFFNLVSLVVWVAALLVLLAALRKPVKNLFIFVFPLASISILAVLILPDSHLLVNTSDNPKQLWHILLSTLAFSVLWIAALQAALVAIQDWQLRHKQPSGILRFLPSLESMESVLFQIIVLGFILLTLVLITSVIVFYPLNTPILLHKALVSTCAWLIFAALLFGRYFFGWRGKTAIRWTLCGVLLLMVVYFGSRLLLM